MGRNSVAATVLAALLLVAALPLAVEAEDHVSDVITPSNAWFDFPMTHPFAAGSGGTVWLFGSDCEDRLCGFYDYTAALETQQPPPQDSTLRSLQSPAQRKGTESDNDAWPDGVFVPPNATTGDHARTQMCTLGCVYFVRHDDGMLMRYEPITQQLSPLSVKPTWGPGPYLCDPSGDCDSRPSGAVAYDGRHIWFLFGGADATRVQRYDIRANVLTDLDLAWDSEPGVMGASAIFNPTPSACVPGCILLFGGSAATGAFKIREFDPATLKVTTLMDLGRDHDVPESGAIKVVPGDATGEYYLFGIRDWSTGIETIGDRIARFRLPDSFAFSDARASCPGSIPAWTGGRAVMFGGVGCSNTAEVFVPVQNHVPGIPSDLQAFASPSSVALGWEEPSSDGGVPVSEYRVYRSTGGGSFSLLGERNVGDAWFIDGEVSIGATYEYRVTSVNAVGESLPAQVSATATSHLPSMPENISITPSNASATLAWDPPLSDGGNPLDGYSVYRNNCAAPMAKVADTTTPGFTDTPLTNGAQYCYEVRAVTVLGEGPASDTVRVQPRTTPGSPTNVASTPQNTQVVLSWTAGSSGGAGIEYYRVYRTAPGGSETLVATLFGNVFTYTDTGLTNGVEYGYQLSASNEAGEGAKSAVHYATPSTIPTAPLSLRIEPHNARINLTWNPPTSNGGAPITGYVIQRSTGGTYTDRATVGVSTSYSDTGLTNGQNYCYRVLAVNLQGRSPASTIQCAIANAVPSPITIASGQAKPWGVLLTMYAAKFVGDAPIDRYYVCWSPAPNGVYTCYTDDATVEANGFVTYEDRSTYAQAPVNCYRAYAENAHGSSPAGNQLCVNRGLT